jgi:hypothetical protein
MHDLLRYGREGGITQVMSDGYLNYHYLLADPLRPQPRLMLEAGINANAEVIAADGGRLAAIAIRSSPWKAGHESNPWHDEFDLDHGHVRYYGDHKATTPGLPGATRGNGLLLKAFQLHAATDRQSRALAPPLLLFRAVTVQRGGRRLVKGHVEFCGAALIERLEHIVQRDPDSGRSFPNFVLDLAVVDLADAGDALDLRWIDDRRDGSMSAETSLRYAPRSWRRWVERGRVSVSGIRRRVSSSRVKTSSEQMPAPGSTDDALLQTIYRFFDGRKHSFELLASWVAADVLGGQGGVYRQGWLSRAGGDGGLDFVGRLDVGSAASNTPLVVLGQAKCVTPGTSISADQVARIVARLRRGWLGVFVTTGIFSKQAQIEVVDDEYPLVLIHGLQVVEHVRRMAATSYDGDTHALLNRTVAEYEAAITHRRPEEMLSSLGSLAIEYDTTSYHN